jgi:hypothetical protein
MSYLDVPRLHFSGTFKMDPSTRNNNPANYQLGANPDPSASNWNPLGTHLCSFAGMVVRAVDSKGEVKSTAADDTLIGATVELLDGRAVDLDPEAQPFTQIYGATVKLTLPGGGSVSGALVTATIRDIWAKRTPSLGGARAAGGVWQSKVTPLAWDTKSTSPVFDQLRTAASQNALSIKLVVYQFDFGSKSAKMVGSIGAQRADDEDFFLGARRLGHGGTLYDLGGAAPDFFPAPFKLDAARKRLIVDLGNCLSDDDRVGSALGRMHMAYRDSAGALIYLGSSMSYDTAHYEATAGIEEIKLTSDEVKAAKAHGLLLKVETPKARVILSELPSGSYIDARQIVYHVDPGTSVLVVLSARELGAGKSGQAIDLALLRGTSLSFPASVTTNAAGTATFTLTGSNPITRRFVDGEYCQVSFNVGGTTPSKRRGVLHVHVYSDYTIPATPTWADVKPIFGQYAQLYPAMKEKGVDLSDERKVRQLAVALAASMRRPIEASNYMPVTRDLSAKKRTMILKWLDMIIKNPKAP